MAKHLATCSSCGRTLDVAAAPGERIVCGECEATRALPGAAPPPNARSPQGSGGPPAEAPAKAGAADPLLGQCLGPFEIVGFLGHGGMGTVYKASQASVGRLVAVKVLAPALAADADFVARFEREARSGAAVHHPNIIRVYSVGQERGYQYIAMELVEGESLAQVLARERQLPPERALGLLKQVAGALAEAHACGIVHRDIKPANILVTPEGVAKVADFGLAKRQASDVTVTQTGTTLGTPLYIAPEIGRGLRLDARSDLYSLGATFYHLLAGRPPFQADTAPELIVKHASELPPPLGAVAPHVDPRFSRIIDQLLCKHPEERVPSAKALLDRLEALGPLQTPDEAAQAEARAMLLAAPTLAMSPGHQLERQAAAERLRRGLQPGRNVKRLVIAAAGALVLLAAVVVLVGGVGRKPTGATKPPSPPPASVERERKAQIVFERAQAAEAVGQSAAVLRELDQLDRNYADTQFCATRKEAIADLRGKAEERVKRGEPAPPPKLPAAPGEWVSLFDGKTLDGWRVAEGEFFAKQGEVRVENGQIVLGAGGGTGIVWQREFPASDYEVAFEAMKVQGAGDFGSVLFPVGVRHSYCALLLGGWGETVGLNYLDGQWAWNNVTTVRRTFEPGRWVRVRLRVTPARIQAWLDDEAVVDLAAAGHWFGGGRLGRSLVPFGLYSWDTTAALRNLRLRRLDAGEVKAAEREGEKIQAVELAVPAQAEWYQAGLLLTEGETYEIAASGRWGTNPPISHGPAGEPGKDGGQLLARVGDGPPIAVGERHSFAALSTGWLYLGFRDHPDGYDDNWGSMQVTVKGPLVADKQARLLSRFDKTLARVEVRGQEDWQSTGLDLRRGDLLLLLTATGTWSFGGQATDANGLDAELNGLRPGMLIARIGEKGEPFAVAALHVLEAVEPGTLYLRMHALGAAGNSGSLNVTIRSMPGAAPLKQGDWVSLFDGKTLDGWRVADRGVFAGPRNVRVEDAAIVLGQTATWTGIICTQAFPATNYELEIEATPLTLESDFCGVSFPVGGSGCCLAVNGGGGGKTGLGWIDGRNGDANGTVKIVPFQLGRPYRVRLSVTDERIEAWIDQEKLISVPRQGHDFSRFGQLDPMGVYTVGSRATLRSIRLRRLAPEPQVAPPVVAQVPDKPGEWVSLFDGKALDGWRVADAGEFARHGQVRVEEGRIVLERGEPRTGIAYLGALPTTDYEVALEARREGGEDLGDVLFPVGGSHCLLSTGGWGGRVLGLSNIDGRWAPDNETGRRVVRETGRWYRVRVRVTEPRIRVWIDEKAVVDLPRAGHTIAPVPVVTPVQPFGVACWNATMAVRNIRFQRVEPEAAEPPPAIVEPPEAGPPPELPSRPGEWGALFDGKSLSGWRVVQEGQFARRGSIRIADGGLVLERGSPRTGVAWTGEFPTSDYELALEARREPESESLCDLLFPVGSSLCTLNVGAWGMNVVGLSRVDGREALDNYTCTRKDIEAGRWYRLRLQVTAARVEAWMDDEKLIDLPRDVAQLSPEPAIYPLKPLGLGTWQGKSTFSNIRLRRLEGKPEGPPVGGSEIKMAAVAASAQVPWLHTGLYLTKGSEYTLSATGRWGARLEWRCGPEGMDWGDDLDFPVFGAPARFGLIGRVGSQGQPFHVGAALQVTAPTSGRLYLGMNDQPWRTDDNWGSLRVTVSGPLVADKAAPLLSRFTKVIQQVQVDARGDWTPTGVELQRGDVVLVTATGRWNGGAGLGETDANGLNRESGALRLGALTGRIGKDGESFTLGALRLLEAQESGTLHLAMHDPQRFDNEGSLAVTIASSPELDQLREKPKGQADLDCRLLATLRGHFGWVVCVAFSPDGAQVASAGRDMTVKLWDAATGQCLKTLRGHLGGIEAVAFSPDGQRLLSSGFDKTVRVWDAQTGACLKTLEGHTAEVFSVAFFRDGKSAISGSTDGQIKIWDLATGDCQKTLTDPSGPMHVRFAIPLPDGKRALSAGGDGAFRLWDLGAGTCVRKWNGGSGAIWGLGLSPDGERIVAAGDDHTLRAWNVAAGALLTVLQSRRQNHSVAFSPDGKWMATGCNWGVIEFWDAAMFEKVRTVQAHNGAVWKLIFSPDSKRLAAASFDGTATVWELTPTPKKPD